MKIFLSWSGNYSMQIAAVLRDWIPSVLQYTQPYYTPSDIDKGSRWSSDIAKWLDESSVGLFVLTKSNINSSWMSFEAGAISKKIDASLVCPLLFGIENKDIKGPLSQFQTCTLQKEEYLRLLTAINDNAGDRKLSGNTLSSVFEMWWPKLKGCIDAISDEGKEGVPRDQSDILNEILILNRRLASTIRGKGENPELLKKIGDFVSAFEFTFDMDWGHSRDCFEMIESFVSPQGTFINPKVDDEDSNWSNRAALLNSYRQLLLYCRQNGVDVSRWWDNPGEKD